MLASMPTGSAPLEAISLALIWTAILPAPFSAPVTGSVENTIISPLPASTAQQSSPIPGCISTSFLWWCRYLKTDLLSIFSGTFPISILSLQII